MKLILRADVKNLGKKDDIVEVSDGYGRNFLIPKGLAVEANAANVNKIRDKQQAAANKQQREREAAVSFRDKLEGKTVVVKAKAGENGKLFGAVGAKDIADAVEQQYGLVIDKKKIVLDEPIKMTGVRKTVVKLFQGINANIDVKVEGN